MDAPAGAPNKLPPAGAGAGVLAGAPNSEAAADEPAAAAEPKEKPPPEHDNALHEILSNAIIRQG